MNLIDEAVPTVLGGCFNLDDMEPILEALSLGNLDMFDLFNPFVGVEGLLVLRWGDAPLAPPDVNWIDDLVMAPDPGPGSLLFKAFGPLHSESPSDLLSGTGGRL